MQFSLAKKQLDLLEGSASNNEDGNNEDEISEQKGEKFLLVRMYQVRGSGRCYDKRLTRKDTRDNTLEILEVPDSTAGGFNSNDKEEKNDRIKSFQRMDAAFPHSSTEPLG